MRQVRCHRFWAHLGGLLPIVCSLYCQRLTCRRWPGGHFWSRGACGFHCRQIHVRNSLGLLTIQLNGLRKWIGNKTKEMIEGMIVYWLKWFESVDDDENRLQWIDDIDNIIGWWDDGDIAMLVLIVTFNVAANLRLPEFSSAHVVRGASGGVRVVSLSM